MKGFDQLWADENSVVNLENCPSLSAFCRSLPSTSIFVYMYACSRIEETILHVFAFKCMQMFCKFFKFDIQCNWGMGEGKSQIAESPWFWFFV